MDFDEVIKSRRSVRIFSGAPVSDETVRYLLDCALHAPSSMNGQPWRFIIIRSSELKLRISQMKDRHCPAEKREYSAKFIQEAPVVIVTCVDRAHAHDRGMESGILATGHLLLAAASRGLTGIYLSAYTTGKPQVEQDIRDILEIPAGMDPITLVPIGYPGDRPSPKTIKTADEVIYHEIFGQK